MNTENIYLALQLMVVGMATVFLILYIIIAVVYNRKKKKLKKVKKFRRM